MTEQSYYFCQIHLKQQTYLLPHQDPNRRIMSDGQGELSRFLHWGPFTALSVTLTVFITTWVWWPADTSMTTGAHFGLYLLLNLLSVYNYVTAVLVGPGWLPRNWQPMHCREAKFLQYCKKCKGYKAPRSHHCRRCDRCVKKMDHHCPWINHCVGWNNQSYFVYFLFFYMMSNLHSAVVLGYSGFIYLLDTYLRRHRFEKATSIHGIVMCIFSFALSVGIVICMLKLLGIQLTGIVHNMTEIEQWILEKARKRRNRCGPGGCSCSRPTPKPFIYPYDLGWWSNLGQVFNLDSQTRSRGVDWPVRKGCDLYALTREQLAQKVDKRLRTRTFRCTRSVSGYWLPILSQGMMVTFCIPCTDEPRICLEPNDVIKVTRLQRYWLFGERVEVVSCKQVERTGAIRGWFPRRCAVDITNESQEKGGGESAPERALKETSEKTKLVGKLSVD